jgi:hypothetical protein
MYLVQSKDLFLRFDSKIRTMSNDIIFTEARLNKLALHRVGNKSRQEGIFPSKKG